MNSFLKSALLTVLLSSIYSAQSTAQEKPAYIVVGGGSAGVLDDQQSTIGMAEFHPKFRAGPFGTWIGGLASDQEYYLGAGLLLDWDITENLFITPSFGAGLYGEHNGIDLGHILEFRSGVEFGYDMKDSGRISVGLWHLSNADLGDCNPGTEVVALRYAIPFSSL